jgi:hypothetical protein
VILGDENIEINAEWERCRHYIEAALGNSPGFESIEDVERLLEDGTYMLWTGADSAVVARIVIYPNRKVFEIMHGGGDKAELIHRLGPLMESFALRQGCDAMAVMGRKGWIREGEKIGWHLGYVCMMKSLKH